MKTMMNIEKTVLLYPEPDATGGSCFDMSEAVMSEYERKPWEESGGGEQSGGLDGQSGTAADDVLADLTGDTVQDDAGDSGGGDDDPFDFTKSAAADNAGAGDAQDGEYELDLGESFGGSDEVRAMITSHAREQGLPADKAGAFVAAVCDSLRAGVSEQRRNGYAELKREWKRDFDANFQGTKQMLSDMLKSGVIKAEQVEEFKSPAVFRALNYLRGRMGEHGTKGLRGGDNSSRAAELKDILENPDNALSKILMNPLHPKYASTAEYVNGLAGMKLY